MASHLASFTFPTAMVFGSGATAELPVRLKQMGGHRALVVTDHAMASTRAFDLLANHLGRSNIGKTWELFDGVHSNPVEQDVVNAATAFREAKCDIVIAFGGGSALDVGKVMRLLVKKPDLSLSKYNFNDDWANLPRCIAVPTTAGSGNEVRRHAAISLAGTQHRATLFLPRLMPKLVVLDPDLTRDLSPQLTAVTGVDALTHCIEAFTSAVFNPLCDALALEAIRTIIKFLPQAVTNGRDVDARGHLLVAATMSGVAAEKELGATHSLAHALAGIAGMHQGTANAVCLPAVMHYNAQRKPGLYRRIGGACNLDVAHVPAEVADFRTIEFIKKFITDLGIKVSLQHYGIRDTQIDALSAQAFTDESHLNNPVPVNGEDFKVIIRSAL